MPDEEERAEILQLIAIGLQNGTPKTSDAITIKQVLKSNVKLAAQYLILREKKTLNKNKRISSIATTKCRGSIPVCSGSFSC